MKHGDLVRCIRPNDVLWENAIYRVVYVQEWVYVHCADMKSCVMGTTLIPHEKDFALKVTLKEPLLIVEAVGNVQQPGGFYFDQSRFKPLTEEIGE